MITAHFLICKTGPVDISAISTVMAVDQSGLTTSIVQATRGHYSNVHTETGAFMTVITVMMYQSFAATVSVTQQQPSIQFPVDKFSHSRPWLRMYFISPFKFSTA